jgi:exodeoxyribonuclease VII large subunit
LLLLERRADAVERCGQLLNALSHRGVLARGFALVRSPDGRPLRYAAKVSEGMRLDIELSDGNVRARAEASIVTPADKPQSILTRKRRGRRGSGDPGQGSLFGE